MTFSNSRTIPNEADFIAAILDVFRGFLRSRSVDSKPVFFIALLTQRSLLQGWHPKFTTMATAICVARLGE
jgi:hypothetical protein